MMGHFKDFWMSWEEFDNRHAVNLSDWTIRKKSKKSSKKVIGGETHIGNNVEAYTLSEH